MRALAKEPEVRYQSCREMLEDLRNYRALGGSEQNPDATMISPRAGSLITAASTSPGLRGLHGDPSASPVLRSLQSHGGNPSQTPVIRRTGTIQAFEEPKKKQPSWQHLCGVAVAERDCVWRLQAAARIPGDSRAQQNLRGSEIRATDATRGSFRDSAVDDLDSACGAAGLAAALRAIVQTNPAATNLPTAARS